MPEPAPAQSDTTALHRALEAAVGPGQARIDEAMRRAYSTDASPCFVEPRAVVFVRSEAEVVRVLEVCREFDVPITPRASGTSLSGAAIGSGVVLDTTGLNRIVELDLANGWVRVEPGVLLSVLSEYLATKGLRFPIEPGSADLCRIGGMVGHNASGYRSVKYRQTRDWVVAMRVVLADGYVLDAHDVPIRTREWEDVVKRVPGLEAVRRLVERNRAEILHRRRPIRKHSCGYDLLAVAEGLERDVFPLATLFVGSEGTLGIVTEVTLRILPVSGKFVTVLMYLDRFEDLGPLVADVLPLQPSAMEAIDGESLTLLGRDPLGVPKSARAMLLVEFDEGDVAARARTVKEGIGPRYPLSCPIEVAHDPERQAHLWKVRRSVLPTLIRGAGRRKPWGFVEDPIVPRERVPDFMEFLAGMTKKYGTAAAIYGHIGDGNTHYRPLFDPTDPEDFARMQALRVEFDEAVLERFRGAPSAEHGIGRLRAETLPRVWGQEVYEAMRSTKEALDPLGILNPGVIFSDAKWWETWAGLDDRVPM